MKLTSYLTQFGETHASFARKIGTTQAAVSRYAGLKRMPRPAVLARIIMATEGKVTANDFLPVAASDLYPAPRSRKRAA